MPKREETVRVHGLETGYKGKNGDVAVTRSVDASLYSGELTCLLGPNGAGKSTLLKTLTAFIPPLKGKIYIESKEISDYNDSELSKVIGVVLTDKLSINNMTVEELVGMGRSPYTGFWGRITAGDKEVIDESISLVGIEELRGRNVRTLSDGERQKVMIAKALSQQTPIIFLDEPTAFLDYPSKVEIMRLLQRLSRERGKTVFLSTHDLELALQIADKVWLLDKARGLTIGTPEDLSLTGKMGEYFSREGVTFDISTGSFKISHEHVWTVRIEGSGPRANMLKKALARNGIFAGEDADGSLLITASDRCYVCGGIEYDSIEALLCGLACLGNNSPE